MVISLIIHHLSIINSSAQTFQSDLYYKENFSLKKTFDCDIFVILQLEICYLTEK